MALGVGLVWTLLAKDNASPAFLRVAGAADKAAASTARATKSIGGTSAAMGAAGAKLTKGLTVPLLGIAAVSVKAATDFQASMERIHTQAGGTQRDVAALSRQVLAMKGAQQGPNALAAALYHLKSVGMDNADAMRALKTSSDLAAVGNADLEETTNALAGAWRTGIKGAQDFHQAAATVNAIIGAGNMSLADFTEALSTGILPSAKTFGLTLKDVGSALALFTDESVPANVAATRLRMTFSLLAAPSKAAEEQLNKIGLTGFQLGEDMRKPNGLITAVGDLKQHLDDAGLSGTAAAQLLSHAFGGGRSSSAILGMINNFDVLKMKQDQVTRSLGRYDESVRAQRETAAAQFHKAIAEFEQAGVKLGTELLPIATQVAHVITGIASGFSGLSKGQQHFVVVTGIALAALGPLLSLTGKVSGAFTKLSGKFGTFGVVAANAGRALAGAGIGFLIGSMARNASDGTKALTVLGSTMMGLAVGGPIGALAGLLGGLAGAFGLGSNGAAKAAAELAANVQELTPILKADGGAVRSATKDWIGHKLVQDGILDMAPKLGLSYATITHAVMGSKTALAAVNAVVDANRGHMDGARLGAVIYAQKILDLHDALNASKHAYTEENRAAIAAGAAHRDSAQAASRSADALGNLAAGSHEAAAATHTFITATHGARTSAEDLGKYIRSLTKSFLGLVSAELSAAQSEDGFLESVHSLTKELHGQNDTIGKNSKAGLANRDSFLSAASAALSYQDAQRKAGVGVREANGTLLKNIEALRGAAIAAGANKGAVDRLLGSLHLLPHDIRMALHLDGAGATMQQLRDIQNQVNSMHGKTLFVGVTGGHTLGVATGGPVRGPGTGTSDSIPARLSNGEFVVRASQARKHRSLLNSINRGARGFAAGGSTDPKTYRLTGPGADGSTFSTLAAANRGLAHVIASLNRVFAHMSRRDLPKLTKALGKTGSDVKSAFGAWLDDAKQLGIGTKHRRSLTAEAGHVAHLVNVRNRDRDRLHTLIQNRAAEKQSVAGAVRGSFDITQAGANPDGSAGVSFGAINAQALQQKNIVNKWASGIRKLAHEGFNKSPTGLAMLRQLAEAGPSTWPQVEALLTASPKKLAGLVATERSIAKTGADLGSFLGGTVYGDKITAERRELRKDREIARQEMRDLIHEIRRVANRPVEVDIDLDGKKVASGVAHGSARNARRK